VVTFTAVIASAIAYLKVTPNVYETSARIMLDDKRVNISELERDLKQAPPGKGNPLADQAELVKSETVTSKALAKVFPPSNSAAIANAPTTKELKKALKVKIVPATNILELSYQNQDPNLTAKLLNSVVQALIEENIHVISSEARKVREFLEKEVPIARKKLEKAEFAENKYRQQSGVVAMADQIKSLVDSLENLEAQERTLLTQLQATRSRDKSLRQITTAENSNKAYSSVRSGQDEQLKKLKARLSELETQLLAMRVRFTDDHPTVISLVKERDAIRGLYTQELNRISDGNATISPSKVAADQLSQTLFSELITNEIESLAVANQLNILQSIKTNLQARLAELPIKQQSLTVLTREREEAAVSLKLLQTKLEEARVAEAQKVSNLRMIDEAKIPTKPTAPKPLAILVIATVFGSILAISIILLLELLDKTLHDGSEAEKLLQLPVLGALPSLPLIGLSLEAAETFLDDVGLVEPYRMLLKNIDFRSSDQVKTILVTSALAGEGKSVVVAHLAAVSAMLYRRTLIIDADLTQPCQHSLFNLPLKPGITDGITERKSLLDMVQPTDIENLSVLTSGELRGHSSLLLESDTMRYLIAEARLKYETIIIDTAPVNVSADAYTLGKLSDAVLIIARPRVSIKEILQRTVSELAKNGINILGLVVNDIKDASQKHYRYPINANKPILSKQFQRLASLGSSKENTTNGLRSK
jgi:capsular exopolysaccharide synthesis family protein